MKHLGIVLVVVILVGILQAFVGTLVGMAVPKNSFLDPVVSTVLGILFKPLQLGALTLLYYDLRIRKEGFTGDDATSTPLTAGLEPAH